MVDAFRARGLRTGFYHSLLDWHHPQYVMDDKNGPYRDHPDREKMNRGRDQKKYAEYLYNQTRELLTKFGQVDVLWYDFSFPHKDGTLFGKGRDDWQSQKLYKLIRQLQPNVLIDDRLDLPGVGDFKTPEQLQPTQWPTVDGVPVTWEACQTLSGNSWGYARDEHDWRSVEQLVQTLIDSVSKGGNLLLNVGPTGRGELDERALDRLTGIGQWMRRHSHSIYGCTQAPAEFNCPHDCRLTYNPSTRRLYVHLFAWPYKFLHLSGFAGKVEYAQLLHDASELKMGIDEWHSRQLNISGEVLTLRLPLQKPAPTVPVIEIILK
jgi:alpha-L-fucosidase